MIKQSKLSKICWALVYLFPLICWAIFMFVHGSPDNANFMALLDVFDEIPYFNIHLFSISPLTDLLGGVPIYLDRYLGYLVVVSLFRIVWKVLVYLPDVIGKLIDRWSL